ncbi:MAG: redoxin domain-containing protein [Prosthecobacter sp.]|uniref:redoxin domain-containing protein n=1 Tax=Prosthecobacter sp. TaxID=1965333 RepID=UPI0038FFAEE8
MKRIIISLVLLATACFAQSANSAADQAQAFEATTTAGAKLRFPEDYKGKIVMLDFWATWCGPCIAEVPNLTAVFADLKPKGFEVLGISLDNERTQDKLAQFTKDKGMVWPQICDGKGWEAELGKLYGVRAIPACFLVDGTTGKLLAKGTELRGASLRPTIEKALGLPLSNTPPVAAKAATPAAPAAPPAPPDPLLEIAAEAVKSGKFMRHDAVVAQMKAPKPGQIVLQQPLDEPQSGRQIATMAREAYLRAGWYYRCTKCDKMHLNLAGAYAVAPDVVATANHVLEPPTALKEGWLILADERNELHAATAVLASDARMDAALVRVAAGGLKPLALRGDAVQGEKAWCYSDPLGNRSYFSDGIVNRIYASGGSKDPAMLRMNVSTDWAQGSSGAAILDDSGNVIGHVARIQTFPRATSSSNRPVQQPTGTTLVLHEAIAGKAVLQLVERTNAAAAK